MYSGDVRRRALAEVASGASAREAARRAGVSRNAVREWCAAAGVALAAGRRGGAVPEPEPAGPRTSPRSRLTLAHRVLIAAGLRRGDGPRAIGRELGFAHTTVAREVRRGRSPDGAYRAVEAERAARERASRPRAGKLERDPRLRAEVVRRLALRWSPAQVSASLERDFPGEEGMRVSHETVYRALYAQGRGSLREELEVELVLRSGRRSRRRRSLPVFDSLRLAGSGAVIFRE